MHLVKKEPNVLIVVISGEIKGEFSFFLPIFYMF